MPWGVERVPVLCARRPALEAPHPCLDERPLARGVVGVARVQAQRDVVGGVGQRWARAHRGHAPGEGLFGLGEIGL